MKRLIVLGLFIHIIFGRALAQDDVFRHPLGPQTTAAFTAACSRLAERPFTRGNFEQEKILSRLNRSLKSSGNFIFAASMGMVWDTLRPVPSTLTLGSDYLIQSRPGGQRTLMNAQGNETFIQMAGILSSLFSGNARGLLDNFEVYFSGSAASWELGLIPRDNVINAVAQRIIMKGDTVIRFIHIFEQNGDSIQYALSNHSFPSELSLNERAFFTLP